MIVFKNIDLKKLAVKLAGPFKEILDKYGIKYKVHKAICALETTEDFITIPKREKPYKESKKSEMIKDIIEDFECQISLYEDFFHTNEITFLIPEGWEPLKSEVYKDKEISFVIVYGALLDSEAIAVKFIRYNQSKEPKE